MVKPDKRMFSLLVAWFAKKQAKFLMKFETCTANPLRLRQSQTLLRIINRVETKQGETRAHFGSTRCYKRGGLIADCTANKRCNQTLSRDHMMFRVRLGAIMSSHFGELCKARRGSELDLASERHKLNSRKRNVGTDSRKSLSKVCILICYDSQLLNSALQR